MAEPYIHVQAPLILSQKEHEKWIRAQCLSLREAGYTFFRASFPDDRPSELHLEGWIERPEHQGPCPWEKDYVANTGDYSGPLSLRDASAVATQSETGMGSLPEQRPLSNPSDHRNRPARSGQTLVLDTGRALLDGSPVPVIPSYQRKRPDGQQTSYVVMSDQKLAGTPPKRPMQNRIMHLRCRTITEMHTKMAYTIARDPTFYKALFCARCKGHFKIGSSVEGGEFLWDKSDQRVGT